MKNMKPPRLHIAASIALGLFSLVHAQTVTTETTTTSAGTITTVTPTGVVLQTEPNVAPLRYSITKTTQYVDETGAPVEFETVRSGLPVTVHYVKEGDQMLANRVVVRRGKSTVTSTNGSTGTTTKTTFTAGTVSEFSPEVLTVRTTQSGVPVRYSYTKTTRYVDDTGAPVAVEQVTSGRPVTVHYVKEGNRHIAQRVVVHKTATAVPPPQVIEERTKTTTTVEKPVKKERKDKDDDDDDEDDD